MVAQKFAGSASVKPLRLSVSQNYRLSRAQHHHLRMSQLSADITLFINDNTAIYLII